MSDHAGHPSRKPNPLALAQPCDYCGAKPGEHCHTRGGSGRVQYPHLERRKLAARMQAKEMYR